MKLNKYVYIALAGRAPVKIDGSNGPIKTGDMLTISDITGHAKLLKSDESGIVVGIAMEDWNSNSTGKIVAFVKNGFYSNNSTIENKLIEQEKELERVTKELAELKKKVNRLINNRSE